MITYDKIENVNLRDLFTLPYKDIKIPDWVDAKNCIYRIINLVNGKSYIGQAKWFYGRLVDSPEFSHLAGYQYHCAYGFNIVLYRAINKYKSRNFEVELLDYNLRSDQLNDREIYWIKYFHTYIRWHNSRGYNMNTGGNHTDQLHTPEAIKRQMESNLRNHGGVLAWNTPEVRKRNFELQLANHDGLLAFHTESAIQASIDTRRELYNGDAAGMMHTPEARQKAMNTNRLNHNGLFSSQVPEIIEARIETDKLNHGGVMAWNTESAIFNQRIGKWFTYSDRFLNECDKTVEGYYKRCTMNLIDIMTELINELRLDPRWTKFHEDFYNFIMEP